LRHKKKAAQVPAIRRFVDTPRSHITSVLREREGALRVSNRASSYAGGGRRGREGMSSKRGYGELGQ